MSADRVGIFKKVSFAQFKADWDKLRAEDGLDEEELRSVYENITLPKRGTIGSAGYDFVSPFPFSLRPGEDIVIPTGIRAGIAEGWVLMIFPRSGMGFKYYERCANTVPIIDSDYYFSDNGGHIMLKLRNDFSHFEMIVRAGDKLVQGVFLPYGITMDDDATETRNGGFGSTGR